MSDVFEGMLPGGGVSLPGSADQSEGPVSSNVPLIILDSGDMIIMALELVRGDTNLIDFKASWHPSNPQQDLTGCKIWFTLKESRFDNDPGFLQKTIGDGIQVNVSANTWTVTLDPSDSASLSHSKKFYGDVQIKDALGIVTSQFVEVQFLLDATRAIS